jgi:hypothetical protein
MPDVSTEVAIATTTLGSAAATITFSGISSAYTDLRLILTSNNSSNNQDGKLTFNNDTATNYSDTHLFGDGSSPTTYKETSQAYIALFSIANTGTSTFSFTQVDIFSYTGSTFKTVLSSVSNDKNGSGVAARTVGLWRSTSAITRLDLTLTAGNYNAGTTATLYGIL